MTNFNHVTSKKIWIPIIIIAVFIIPMFAAIILYMMSDYVPKGKNYGILIIPPRSLMQIKFYNTKNQAVHWKTFKRQWYMIYIMPNDCDDLCINNLYKMQRIQRALGKDANRVTGIILTLRNVKTPALDVLLSQEYHVIIHLQIKRETLNQLLKGFEQKEIILQEGGLYLVDPLGNLMMNYNSYENPSHIMKDLQKLLKISQIG